MQRLLAEEPEKAKSFRELILQPQSEIASFRKFLREAGFIIASENMVLEEGKFYPMMKAQPAERISGMTGARPQPDMCKKPEKKEQISRELGERFGAHPSSCAETPGTMGIFKKRMEKLWGTEKCAQRVL